jgi:hypothetical protein
VSTVVAVESFVSVAVDPEPQAVNTNVVPIAKINMYFLINVNIQKIIEITKFNKKNPNEMSGFKVFGWVQPHLLLKNEKVIDKENL